MGKALAAEYPTARRTFEEADAALGFALSTLCFEGPEDALKLTENTQPALLAVSTAAARVLAESGIAPEYVAGHSLGEYSALVTAGSLAFAAALRLVRQRGRYMQEAVPPGVGAMAALLRLPEGALDAVLRDAAQGEVVSAANLNAPDQVVIAGSAAAVNRAIELAKAAGARRAVLLPVGAPFHCELMWPAQQRLAADLNAAAFADLHYPLVNNWQAREVRTAAEARQGLYEQVPNPVRWIESIRYLAAQGIDRFIEVGPGGVLTGLLRSIDPNLRGFKFGEPADLAKLIDQRN
jgi:[acyl-carrier-protein] S-malonyltransferase